MSKELSPSWAKYTANRTLANRNALVEEYIPLLRYHARRMSASRRYDYDDLFNNGCLGLIRAIEKFDTKKGCKFETFGNHCIAGEMKNESRKAGIKHNRKPVPVTSFERYLGKTKLGDTLVNGVQKNRLRVLEKTDAFWPEVENEEPTPEQREIMEAATKGFSEKEKLLCYLRYVQGESYPKIAKAVGMSVYSVFYKLKNLNYRMRDRLELRGVTLEAYA